MYEALESVISCLPINVGDLLHFRGVESARVEFKAGWSEGVGSTADQVLRTICAFANDFYNVNGGYVVIGIEDQNGTAVLPPAGLKPETIESIQQWIRGNCRRIDPEYQPVLSPEVVDGRHILVIWAPASDTRPHQAPQSPAKGASKHFYVRLGAQTVEATGEVRTELLHQTARVPLDDRRALTFTTEAIRLPLVREFLADIRSSLMDEPDAMEVFRCLRLLARINAHEVPRNVALLFFSDDPEAAFPGARIEVVQFGAGPAGAVLDERTFRGPLHRQIRDCLAYLRHLSTAHLEKQANQAETAGWVSFPFPALEETIVNAVYHRSYDGNPEPTKVYLYPDRIEVTSYPGPVPGLKPEDFRPGHRVPQVPARNRRIGEFLKELRLAEARSTGVPTVFEAMARNGSPPPVFEFDEGRTYFTAILPAHPEYVALSAIREASRLAAIGQRDDAIRQLVSASDVAPGSGALVGQLIDQIGRTGELAHAKQVYDRYMAQPLRTLESWVTLTMANAYLDAGRTEEARKILDKVTAATSSRQAIDVAIAERRAGRQERAHQLFEEAREQVLTDPRGAHEFAQAKIKLADRLRRPRDRIDRETRVRLLREAQALLQRVLQMDCPPSRKAWAWFDLGRVRRWLGAPESEVRQAFLEACNLLPGEPRFAEALARLKSPGA